ncbi:MAG: 50S ribosomal protein L13 [Candidatus Woesebacteria bacterium]|jgi:large subunit ribosomal protein L13
MKTYQPKHKEIVRKWHKVDAKGEVLGRLSTRIASLLMGKHKVKFSKHMDMGDYVVVVNARHVRLTGKKPKQKLYRKHSGYPGGFKEIKFEKLIEENPQRVIQLAVKRMLPDNRLRDRRLVRLKVFAEDKHDFEDKFKKAKSKGKKKEDK